MKHQEGLGNLYRAAQYRIADDLGPTLTVPAEIIVALIEAVRAAEPLLNPDDHFVVNNRGRFAYTLAELHHVAEKIARRDVHAYKPPAEHPRPPGYEV